MINYDETEFPPLDSVYGYEYKLNTLFFNLSRKTDNLELSKTKDFFSSLLLDCKDDDSKIDLLFKLVLYTRDIGKGKGEQLAENAAAGFVITDDMLERDGMALRNCNNSLRQLILQNFARKKQSGSFSGTTVNKIIDPNGYSRYSSREPIWTKR
jgi:hypothetical protein